MAEKINPGMEKMFFIHILENPHQIEKVEPVYFKQEEIQFVFKVIRDEYITSKHKKVPTPEQIYAMVKVNDPEKKIPDEFLKKLLRGDNTAIDSEWVKPRFDAWKLSSTCKSNVLKAVDYMRGLDEINYDNVLDITAKMKKMFSDMSVAESDKEAAWVDFDDPEAHMITESNKKISTGWSCMDTLLDGGWDQAALCVLIGETNVGKSMWMQNIASKVVDQGANVMYVTLEMGAQKCLKRMGSMRLKIPASEYDIRTKDLIYMKNKINALKNMTGGMFNDRPGKLTVAKFDTGSMTITDLDNTITDYNERYPKNKLNMILVDYISLMGIEKGEDFKNMLFLKGKHLAEGLRFIADKHNIAVVTATQTDKAVWGANDIDLKNIPESKAIAESADTVFAIIRNPEMKKNNVYRLKILKKRDGEHKGEQIRFKFNTTFLTMEDDEFVGNA